MRRMIRMLLGGLCGIAALGVAIPASAYPVTVSLCDANGCWSHGWTAAASGTSTWTNIDASGVDWSATINSISVNPDPLVTNNFTLTNTSASTQIYTMIATLGTAPQGPTTVTSGSVGGSVTSNGTVTPATMSTTGGTALYTAQIDGGSFHTLLNDPYSVTTPFAGGTANIGPASFGLPGTTFPGPAVASTIGIQIKFSLTAGDSVAFTSNFRVEPVVPPAGVPLPAALYLFLSGIGLLGGVVNRNRRN